MTAQHNMFQKIASVIVFLILTFSIQGCQKAPEPYVSASTTIRDNTPVCLVPSADATNVYSNPYVSIDASHMEEGYIMADYLGESPKVKLQIIGPDYMTYTYDLNADAYEVFPLSAGSGTYTLGVYENIEGSQYATVFSENITVEIEDPLKAFLYPNQYVKFDSACQVVSTAGELVAGAHDELEAINYIYNYVIENISYDYQKAQTVESGYVPDVDAILTSKTGICLDYAAVMTSMLRSQRIPTRLEVGYAGEAYHAWISTYVENQGWINGMIHFDGEHWSIMDPTFAASAGEEAVESFIGDGENYMTKYIY